MVLVDRNYEHPETAPTEAGRVDAFVSTRIRQIARLAALLREHPEEFSHLGRAVTTRAIFSMVMDCRAAHVDAAALGEAIDAAIAEVAGALREEAQRGRTGAL